MEEQRGLKVLVAFDGSELSLEAVKYAASMMPSKNTEVVLFYVETKMPQSFWKFEHDMDFRYKSSNLQGCIAEQHKRINAAMEKAREILFEAGFSETAVKTKIQAKNLGIVNDIFRESHEGYDAVIMGRKGESKIKDMLLGSVPTKLLKKIQGIPMIIVGGACQKNRILVAFDGSKEVMRAVRAMSGLIGASDCKVSFCHVSVPRGKDDSEEEKAWKEKERKRLAPLIETAKACLIDAGFSFNQICCEVISERSDLAGSIVKKANQEEFDAIVIGRRGLSVYKDFVSRRVGEKIFNQSENLTVWVFA